MNIEQVRDFTLSLHGVTEDQPFGDDNITFRVEGKIFLCLWLGDGKCDVCGSTSRFACKLRPDRNEELRDRYGAVTPAFPLEQETLERRVLRTARHRPRHSVDNRVVPAYRQQTAEGGESEVRVDDITYYIIVRIFISHLPVSRLLQP